MIELMIILICTLIWGGTGAIWAIGVILALFVVLMISEA